VSTRGKMDLRSFFVLSPTKAFKILFKKLIFY
jgi:hypothetical protein